MQLLNVIKARSVWLFEIAEPNPRGKDRHPDLFEWLKEPFDFEFGGVSFWPRQSFPPLAVAAFHFERKLNTDRDQHKYFSRAPLQTDDHLQLLTDFEGELMA